VFTARYALRPYIKQIPFVFKGWSKLLAPLFRCFIRFVSLSPSLISTFIFCPSNPHSPPPPSVFRTVRQISLELDMNWFYIIWIAGQLLHESLLTPLLLLSSFSFAITRACRKICLQSCSFRNNGLYFTCMRALALYAVNRWVFLSWAFPVSYQRF
jgi:hypothetical protein